MTNDLDTAKERYVYHRLCGLPVMEAADKAGYSGSPPQPAKALYREACRDPHRAAEKVRREVQRIRREERELRAELEMARKRLKALAPKAKAAEDGELAPESELADVVGEVR